MTRWRTPPEKSSRYITPEGERALRAELRELWLVRRQDVVPALSAAAAEGDRSENAEYVYRKKQLAQMDRRIRYLSRRLDEVEVVHAKPPRQDRVFFGARVTLEDAAGGLRNYRIVGADEIDAAQGWISVDSPMARALLGREIDAVVSVESPKGRVEWVLREITYP